MDFKEVPKGRIIPFYLTDEGDVYPIAFHSEEELDLIQCMVAGLLETVAVDTHIQINDNKYKFSIQERKTEK